jgi:hypothetical protein
MLNDLEQDRLEAAGRHSRLQIKKRKSNIILKDIRVQKAMEESSNGHSDVVIDHTIEDLITKSFSNVSSTRTERSQKDEVEQEKIQLSIICKVEREKLQLSNAHTVLVKTAKNV